MRTTILSTLAFLTRTVIASFDNSVFYFAGNNGNSSALQVCKNMAFACEPPRLCAMNSLTNKHYCCSVSGAEGVCWLNAPRCEGAGDDEPSSSQIPCIRNGNKWCCLKDVEKCSERVDKINMCWSTQSDPVNRLDQARLNQSFSALSAANPSAASYVLSNWRDFGGTSSSSFSATGTGTSAATSTSTPLPDESQGLSGGAIGGIVSGVIVGLALVAAVLSFLWWRRRAGRGLSLQTTIPELHGEETKYVYMKDGNTYSELPMNERPAELEVRQED